MPSRPARSFLAPPLTGAPLRPDTVPGRSVRPTAGARKTEKKKQRRAHTVPALTVSHKAVNPRGITAPIPPVQREPRADERSQEPPKKPPAKRSVPPQRTDRPEKLHYRRTTVLKWIWTFAAALIVVQLVNVQVLKSDELSARAERQQERRIETPARRGRIIDRNGVDMAVSLSATSVAANPRQIGNPRSLARRISAITGEPVNRLVRRLDTNRAFAWVARRVDEQTAERLYALDPLAMWKLPATRRHHPLSTVAGQLIGHVNVDNDGAGGLEMHWDEHLGGRDGWMISLVDAHGQIVPKTFQPTFAPEQGGNVHLTIDAAYQAIVEHELSIAVERWNAAGGLALVYNALTGQVLAMANVPTYDPNEFDRVTDGFVRRNRVLTDPYEPGSTFKIVAASAALAEGKVTPEEVIDCRGKAFGIEDSHPLEMLTFRHVIEKSSNVGTIRVSMRLSDEEFYRWVRRFGFGAETGVDLPSESKGILAAVSSWSSRSHATISMGQEIGVTALQLAAAYGALANDGWLMKPYIVSQITDRDGATRERFEPQRRRQVVPARTARLMTEMLCGVVERGTGRNARMPDLRIAGKTGTAQIAGPDGKGYEAGAYVASFVGFLPDMDPRLVCVVSIARPSPVYYGGSVAAPAFKDIMRRIINRDVEILNRADTHLPVMPNLTGLSVDAASRKLDSLGVQTRTVGSGNVVIGQWPPPSAGRSGLTHAELVLSEPDHLGTAVPDVRGKSVRHALAALTASGLRARLTGSGRVLYQWPAPGNPRPQDGVVQLECRMPRIPSARGGA